MPAESPSQPNPDEQYWLKAESEPVAPVTAWLFPRLKSIEPAKQKAALREAYRKARRHWLSRAIHFAFIAVLLTKAWATWADRVDLRRPLVYALFIVMLISLLQDYLRTRRELGSD